MFYFILVLFIISLYFWWRWLKLLRASSCQLLSGCYPIIGHTHKFSGGSDKVWKLVQEISNECTQKGGIIRIIFALQTFYCITDPEDIRVVANACLKKHFLYSFTKSWLGDGLVTSTTTTIWKRHRKLLSPAFTLQVLNGFMEVFNSQSRELVAKLAVEVEKEPFDILFYLREFALLTVSRTAFGISGQEVKHVFKNFADAVDEIFQLLIYRMKNFWLHNDFIYKVVGFEKREETLIEVLNEMSDLIIKEKSDTTYNNSMDTKSTEKSELRYRALLDILLDQSAENKLTDTEIRDELNTAIVAGFDTSSLLMTVICAYLGTYPEIQEKVVEEIANIFGGSDRDVYKEDLQRLVYTEAVIKETLRLNPTGPVILRTADNDIRLKKYLIRAGDHMVISLYGLNRHPVWGPDAEQFRPERWLAHNVPDSFGGFSVGKRDCIGKTYAMMSMKTALVHLLRRYRFTGDVTHIAFKMDVLLKPVAGHLVSITERKKGL